MNFSLQFMGVGNAQATELGSSGAVLLRDAQPLLLIDCGPETLSAYFERFGGVPPAIFITHAHLDHVGGMERLFGRCYFDAAIRGSVRLYVPAPVLPYLQTRVADYPSVLAEGGANFWDAFRLIAVSGGFWHEDLWFDVFPTRHHAPNTAFGLALAGSFLYSGDTRPIPEMLAHYAAHGELIAHDCAVVGNPSHTGIDDLEREYAAEMRQRMILYHYASAAEADVLAKRGYRVARRLESLALSTPAAQARLPGVATLVR